MILFHSSINKLSKSIWGILAFYAGVCSSLAVDLPAKSAETFQYKVDLGSNELTPTLQWKNTFKGITLDELSSKSDLGIRINTSVAPHSGLCLIQSSDGDEWDFDKARGFTLEMKCLIHDLNQNRQGGIIFSTSDGGIVLVVRHAVLSRQRKTAEFHMQVGSEDWIVPLSDGTEVNLRIVIMPALNNEPEFVIYADGVEMGRGKLAATYASQARFSIGDLIGSDFQSDIEIGAIRWDTSGAYRP